MTILLLYATDYTVNSVYINASHTVLQRVFAPISDHQENVQIRYLASCVLNGSQVSYDHLNLLVSAIKDIAFFKRDMITRNALQLSQGRQGTLESFVELMKTLSSKKLQDDRKRQLICCAIGKNLNRQLKTYEEVEHVVRELRHCDPNEVESMVSYIQKLLSHKRFQLTNEKLDLRGLIKNLHLIAHQHRFEFCVCICDIVKNRSGTLNE